MCRFAGRFLAAMLCVGLAVGGSGCTKKAEETSNTTTTEEVRVTSVDLGRDVGGDRRVTEKVDTFAPNDVIYASVITSGVSPSASLRARWTYQDGQVVDESEKAIAPTGEEATEFHVSKPDGWPAGKYKVEVFLNGNPVDSKEFEVK